MWIRRVREAPLPTRLLRRHSPHTAHTHARARALPPRLILSGIPRYTHHALWLAGWAFFYKAVLRTKDRAATLFATQMILTGLTSVVLCPLGQGPLSDKIHFVTAGMYMVDHHVLLYLLGVPYTYCIGFYGSLAGFAWALKANKRERLLCGLSAEEGDDRTEGAGMATREESGARGESGTRAGGGGQAGVVGGGSMQRVWNTGMAVMLLEYTMFISFVSGMASGVN